MVIEEQIWLTGKSTAIPAWAKQFFYLLVCGSGIGQTVSARRIRRTGLLVANKSARKLLTKYGTNALLVGGGAVAGTVLWNKYKDKIRAAHQDDRSLARKVRRWMSVRNV